MRSSDEDKPVFTWPGARRDKYKQSIAWEPGKNPEQSSVTDMAGAPPNPNRALEVGVKDITADSRNIQSER